MPKTLKQSAHDQLSAIYQRDGALTPRAVVDAARHPDAPLHSWFQWDDGKAAEAYRIEQARRVIRVAVVTVPSLSNKPMRQFVSVSSHRHDGQGSYVAVVDLIKDRDAYEQARRDALDELLRLHARFRHIVELAPVWGAISEAAAQIAQRPQQRRRAG